MVSEFVPVLNRFQEIGTQEGFAQVGEAMKEFGPVSEYRFERVDHFFQAPVSYSACVRRAHVPARELIRKPGSQEREV